MVIFIFLIVVCMSSVSLVVILLEIILVIVFCVVRFCYYMFSSIMGDSVDVVNMNIMLIFELRFVGVVSNVMVRGMSVYSMVDIWKECIDLENMFWLMMLVREIMSLVEVVRKVVNVFVMMSVVSSLLSIFGKMCDGSSRIIVLVMLGVVRLGVVMCVRSFMVFDMV